MAFTSREFDQKDKVASVAVSRNYLSYPRLLNPGLIPDDVFRALNVRWSTEVSPAPTVSLYLAKNAIVAAEGLVFTSSGELIKSTQAGHSQNETEDAHRMLESALASASLPELPRGILCKKRGASNYGHWLIEMLPRAFLARRELGCNDWPILIHACGPELEAICRQSLSLLGVKDSQIVVVDRSPLLVKELLCVDGLTSHSVYVSPIVMECMDRLSQSVATGPNRLVYASRTPARTRDFENLTDAEDVIKRFGYTEVVAAKLPFIEQITAFKSAESVIGPMGAALTNIAFCRPGTEVIVFSPASARELLFWHIASGRNLNYYEVKCEEAGEQSGPLPWDRLLRINREDLANTLHFFRSQRRQNGSNFPALRDEEMTRERVLNSKWTLQFGEAENTWHNVQFLEDGSILGYAHDNERSWQVFNGILEILDSAGACTWSFTQATSSNVGVRLRARYRLSPDVKTVLVIQENGLGPWNLP